MNRSPITKNHMLDSPGRCAGGVETLPVGSGSGVAAATAVSLMRSPSCQVRRSSRSDRSEEHTSELPSLMRISYAVFCWQKKKHEPRTHHIIHTRLQTAITKRNNANNQT